MMVEFFYYFCLTSCRAYIGPFILIDTNHVQLSRLILF